MQKKRGGEGKHDLIMQGRRVSPFKFVQRICGVAVISRGISEYIPKRIHQTILHEMF